MPFRKTQRERALENVLNSIFWLHYNENKLHSAFFTGNGNIANSKWIVIFPAKLLSLWWSPMQPAATFIMDSLAKYSYDKSFAPRARTARHWCCLQPFRAFKYSSSNHHLWSAYFWHSFKKRFGVIVFALFWEDKTFFKDLFPFVLHKSNYFLCCTIGFKEHQKCIASTELHEKQNLILNKLTTPLFFFSLEYYDYDTMNTTIHSHPGL